MTEGPYEILQVLPSTLKEIENKASIILYASSECASSLLPQLEHYNGTIYLSHNGPLMYIKDKTLKICAKNLKHSLYVSYFATKVPWLKHLDVYEVQHLDIDCELNLESINTNDSYLAWTVVSACSKTLKMVYSRGIFKTIKKCSDVDDCIFPKLIEICESDMSLYKGHGNDIPQYTTKEWQKIAPQLLKTNVPNRPWGYCPNSKLYMQGMLTGLFWHVQTNACKAKAINCLRICLLHHYSIFRDICSIIIAHAKRMDNLLWKCCVEQADVCFIDMDMEETFKQGFHLQCTMTQYDEQLNNLQKRKRKDEHEYVHLHGIIENKYLKKGL
jgi:hypothetical protein